MRKYQIFEDKKAIIVYSFFFFEWLVYSLFYKKNGQDCSIFNFGLYQSMVGPAG